MNYSADRPIDNKKDDLLGRSSFSNQLGKAIYKYNVQDGLVIGLFGKWGTGKTSVINMAINKINDLAQNDEKKPLIIRFSPWNYSDKDNLISLFFQSLKNNIDIQDNEDLKNKVGEALSAYSGAFDALSLVPLVGSSIAAILKAIAQALGTNLMQRANLDETRKTLEEELIKVNKKIIIVIDDIDRLSNSQIRDVFQLVKQVADFPNVIYVLAMDREVVCSALIEVHNIDGNEYLEKIIQIPFELPELRKSKLHDIFFKKIEDIINDFSTDVVWDQDYWSNVFTNCVEPYIHTLRDVNRLLNIFQFRYEMLHDETSFEDMVGITTIEVLEPKLYKWISNNKDAVCGGFMHGFLSNSGSKLDYRKVYHDEFERLGIDPDVAISCVSTMFPVFANDVNEYPYNYQPTSDIRGKMRIAHEVKFELYFMFDLDDIKVPRNIINACIYDSGKEKLISIITEINEDGNIVYLLEEIRSLIDNIPYNRLDLIASVILSLQSGFKGENTRSIIPRSVCYISEYLVCDIIKRLKTEEEKYGIISSAVENVDKDGLGAIAKIINGIELAYGRLAGNQEKKDGQIISLAHLKEIEKMYVKRIQDITDSELTFNINNFNSAFYLWKCFDQEGAEKYLKKLFKDEVNKLKFICAIAGRWNGANGSGWSFNSNYYSEYVSEEWVYNIIQNSYKNQLDCFTDIELTKLASFVLNYDKTEVDKVDDRKALELVKKWKTEKEE